MLWFSLFDILDESVSKFGGAAFEPDAVIGWERFGVDMLFCDQVVSIARADQRGKRYDGNHERAEIAVLNGVSMLMIFERGRTVFSAEKEDAEIHAAPIFPERKTVAIAPFLRAVSAQGEKNSCDTAEKRKRQSPCERKQIKEKGRKFGIHEIVLSSKCFS